MGNAPVIRSRAQHRCPHWGWACSCCSAQHRHRGTCDGSPLSPSLPFLLLHILRPELPPPLAATVAGTTGTSHNPRSCFVGVATSPCSHTFSSHLRVLRGWLRTWGEGVERGFGSKQGPSTQPRGSAQPWCPGALGATPFPLPAAVRPTTSSTGQALVASLGAGDAWTPDMVTATSWELPELQSGEGGRGPHPAARTPCLCRPALT